MRGDYSTTPWFFGKVNLADNPIISFRTISRQMDAIITPTQPDIAFRVGEQADDPLKMYLEDLFVAPASLAGLPAISVPMGAVDNMPVGIQFIGKRFSELDIFGLAKAVENRIDIKDQKPVL